MTAEAIAGHVGVPDDEYLRRIRAWTIYDWANSAFATTILAAVLPAYYSAVAGSSLGSDFHNVIVIIYFLICDITTFYLEIFFFNFGDKLCKLWSHFHYIFC